MNKELANGFVDIGTLAKMYADAKDKQMTEVMVATQEAAEAIAMSNAEAAFATTLAAFADETTNGGV